MISHENHSLIPPTLPFSIDWEDWFQLCCPPFDQPGALDRYEDRLSLGTNLALDLCEDLGAKATWFCLTDQAERHKNLVADIISAGHEIALHGLDHRRAFTFTPETFLRWLREGKARLEHVTSAPVLGFRAPEWSFRLAAEDYWRLLPKAGFLYDASRAPLPLLGKGCWPRRAHRLEETLWELPPPVSSLGLPLWGWGLRVLPMTWTKGQIQRLAKENAGTPITLHPWELDEHQPGLPQASMPHRLAHGAGLKGYGARLRKILQNVRLVTIHQWIHENIGSSMHHPPSSDLG